MPATPSRARDGSHPSAPAAGQRPARSGRPPQGRGRPGLPRLPGLDGLRAVAVAAVVLYHGGAGWLPGGFLGVDVFFVLSGFLITSLLLVELECSGRVSFLVFYARRARRLLPALLVTLALCALLAATVANDVATGYRRDLPGVLLYVANWQSILTQASYFEFIGRPGLLQHLWSLAVEEQFYLMWPVVAVLLFRWRGARLVGWVALGGALLSTALLVAGGVAWRMPVAADPSRLYFGTDTHTMGILLGAALAVLWRPGRTRAHLARGPQAVIGGAGLLALLGLVVCFARLGEYSTFLYRGGFLVVAALSAVVVAAASHRGAVFGRVLGIRPLRWIGLRSYGIYLLHWPLFVVTRPGTDIPLAGAPATVLRIAVLLALAELSYRYVELPVRRGALGRAVRRLPDLRPHTPGVWTSVAATAVAVVVVFTGARVLTATTPVAASGASGAVGEAAADPASGVLPWPGPDIAFLSGLARGEPWAVDERARRSGRHEPIVSAFGDSVLLGAAGALQKEGLLLDLHAKVGSQAEAVGELISSRMAAGKLHDRVILHIGDNGIVSRTELTGMLDELSRVGHVAITTVRVPRPWMAPNNALIRQVAASRANVRLVDWAELSQGHPTYLTSDGVHLTAAGARVYADAMREALGLSRPPD